MEEILTEKVGEVCASNLSTGQQPSSSTVAPTPVSQPCSSATMPGSRQYIYALGRIEPRFPTKAVEKEFAQATHREQSQEILTNAELLRTVLSSRENRYLARQLCWVFTIEGIETYLLYPRDPADLDLLIESIRPAPDPTAVDIVIGLRGPIAPPEMCNGLMIPIVAFDQIYSFNRLSLMESLAEKLKLRQSKKDPELERISTEDFTKSANEIFDRIITMRDNAGASDEHRAINYLSVRCDEIYLRTSIANLQGKFLTAQEARPSPLSGTCRILDVIFSYTDRTTDVVEKFFVRVDVTEEFPFLVTKLSPYYER